jgi:hypothetical protein
VLVGRWRPEETIQIDDDLGRQLCGASGMKDGQTGIIVHDQGVLQKWLRTVRAPFRETLNPCTKTLFVGEDEHNGLSLSHNLSIAHTVVDDLREKYTSLLDMLIRSDCPFYPHETSATIRTPLMIKYRVYML